MCPRNKSDLGHMSPWKLIKTLTKKTFGSPTKNTEEEAKKKKKRKAIAKLSALHANAKMKNEIF